MFCVGASVLGGVPMASTCANLSTAHPEVFGPVTWNVLHVLAQKFPDRPELPQIQACTGFVASLPYMLPEGESALAFQRFSIDYPGSLDAACATGPALRQFFCNAHNFVNEHLGKPPLNCSPVNLDAMYGTAPMCVSS